MEAESSLTRASSIIELKLRSMINGQPTTYPSVNFRVKSLRPLQIEDATGLVLSSQSDAPRIVTIGMLSLFELRLVSWFR
jgi:hypothetical protein